MDGLDAEAAAGRFENAGEEGAGALAQPGFRLLAKHGELVREILILEAHPISEPAMDALRHLGGAGLGEGQAEDRRRIHPGQKQPQHPGGEHMGLAGAGRSRQRGMVARRRGAKLVACEACERAEAVGHASRR